MTLRNKAIFLDRDGVINKDFNYVHKREDFKFEKDAIKALKLLNDANFYKFIVTNQSGIAKGYYSELDLKKLHSWLLKKLNKNNITIKKIYYCPHHPDGTKNKYKKLCKNRKPNSGMLLKAKNEYNINLSDSWIIGDKTSDILAGKRVGCKTILVKTGYAGTDNLHNVIPNYTANNLLEAIKLIIK